MKTLDENNNFLALDKKYSSYESSQIVVLPAPYEHSVSYGEGTKNGPKAIISASGYVEFYDDETEKEICFERGIATLEPVDFSDKVDLEALEMIQDKVLELLHDDKFVVTLGGEHTISTAPIKSHFEKYPNMSVLQFDAHSDLRDSYEGSIYSHACVMSRVAEFLNPKKITQVGIRAQCKEEAEFIKQNGVNTFYAHAIRRGLYGEVWQDSVVETLSREIYVTFDVDYFDPSILPSTGTPEPDGFLYHETLEIFRKIKSSGKKIIGFDVVELAPQKNVTHPDILTASLIYKMLNYIFA
jgi:N1-aminopropylagmatine ureohydrolase